MDENKELERERIQAKALELKLQGKSYAQIAHALKIAKATAYSYVKEALTELAEQEKDNLLSLRQLELERLDVQYQEVLNDITERQNSLAAMEEPVYDLKGITASRQVLLKIIEQRAKLLGLYSPEKYQVEEVKDTYQLALNVDDASFEELMKVYQDEIE